VVGSRALLLDSSFPKSYSFFVGFLLNALHSLICF
jgi:hypothetical protein